MTFEQFWYGPPNLCESYRKLHRLRVEQRNQELWLQGLYNYDALAVALNNAFSKHKEKYITEPFKLFEPTEEEKQREIEETRKKMIARLDAWKQEFDKAQKTKSE